MTREEKIKLLQNYCDVVPGKECNSEMCKAFMPEDFSMTLCKIFAERTNEELDETILRAINGEVEQPDALDHPNHYNREGAMECIEEMLLIFGIEETMSFCKLNAWKYRYRAADKGGQDDLEKSDRYLAKYKELKERRK